MSLIRRLWQSRSATIALYSHFHRPFVHSTESSWVHPRTFIDDLSGSGIESLPRGPGSVDDFRKYMPDVPDRRYAQIFGQQALEYWLYKNTPSCDFIGCSTYRRYLMISGAHTSPYARMAAEPTAEILANLTSDEQRDTAMFYLQSADVISNRIQAIDSTIEQQYLGCQPAEYWNLMMEGIETLFPAYKPHMLWFRDYNCVNFETTYIMRRTIFLKYAKEFFSILEYVFKNASTVVPNDIPGNPHQPCRYPGFLGERFFPFFLYANALRVIQVPLVFIGD